MFQRFYLSNNIAGGQIVPKVTCSMCKMAAIFKDDRQYYSNCNIFPNTAFRGSYSTSKIKLSGTRNSYMTFSNAKWPPFSNAILV